MIAFLGMPFKSSVKPSADKCWTDKIILLYTAIKPNKLLKLSFFEFYARFDWNFNKLLFKLTTIYNIQISFYHKIGGLK